MDLLSLLCSCSLTCTDSPNWLVCYDNVSHLLWSKSIKNVLYLLSYNLEVTTSLTLLKLLTDAATANRAGLYCIIVPPIKDKTNAFFRFKRWLEKPYVKKWKKTHQK